MEIMDPRPWLEELYQQELAALTERLGKPRTAAERMRFHREKRALRRRIFEQLPRSQTVMW